MVLYRGFRQAAPHDVRNITVTEFTTVAEELQPEYGNVVLTCLRRQSKDTVLFVKRNTNDFDNFAEDICSRNNIKLSLIPLYMQKCKIQTIVNKL